MLAVILLNFNKWELTINAVRSIDDTYGLGIMIYVVDNGSSNDSYNRLYQEFQNRDNIKIIRSEVNIGFAAGNNLGIKRAYADGYRYAIISNNDVIFCEKSINIMYDFIKKNQKCILAGPRIYLPNGDIQYSIQNNKPLLSSFLSIKPRGSKELNLYEKCLKSPANVYSVSGCCFIINVENFHSIGLFDTNTFLYNEENILAEKIYNSEYTIYYVPTASVIHDHGSTTGKRNLFVDLEFYKSSLYYWRVYRNASKLLIIFMFLIYLLKSLVKVIYYQEIRNGYISYIKQLFNETKLILKFK